MENLKVWILRIVGGVCALILVLSLAQYHPTDPFLWATGAVASEVRNLCGGIGANFAGILQTLVGFGGWLVPVYLLWELFPMGQSRVVPRRLSRFGWLVMAFAVWTLLGGCGTMTWAAQESLPAVETRIGGWFGSAFWSLFRSALGPVGLPIALGTLVLLSLLLISPELTQFLGRQVVKVIGERFWPWFKPLPGRGGRGFLTLVRRPFEKSAPSKAAALPTPPVDAPDVDAGDLEVPGRTGATAAVAAPVVVVDEGTAAMERALRENEALRRKGGAVKPEEGLPVIHSMLLSEEPYPEIQSMRLPSPGDVVLEAPPGDTYDELVLSRSFETPAEPLPRPELLRDLPPPPPTRPPVVRPIREVDGHGNIVEQRDLGLTEPTPREPLPEPPRPDWATRRVPSQDLGPRTPPQPLTPSPRTPTSPVEMSGRSSQPRPQAPKRPPTEAMGVVDRLDLPPRRLFDPPRPEGRLDNVLLEDTRALIQQKLIEFKVKGTVTGMQPGPVVTVYEFAPDPGVPLSKVMGMEEDLALGLQVEKVRIDRIAGRNLVGIEVPNPKRETITFREIVDSPAFRDPSHKDGRSLLTLALGKDIAGVPVVADLASMPHLLIGGSTGSGKSVGVNAMICSILLRAMPHEAKLILIDPKMVELGIYEDVPHLWAPVVTDMKEAGRVLKWVVAQMEDRYRRLALMSVRNLEGFNHKIQEAGGYIDLSDRTPNPRWPDRPTGLEPLPYVVVVIDELADLMMVCRSEVEESIARIAQKARAVGIHLVLATQRPSVDIVTGVIKANLPSRLSYRVNTKIDSRTILDSGGGEQLLGKGDALFLAPGNARPRRIHAPFLTEEETLRLTGWLKERGKPDYNQALLGAMEADEELEAARAEEDGAAAGEDDVYTRALAIVKRERKASTSLLQRKLNLGYGRAARLIDRMEEEGIIGPDRGAGKPREVYAPEEV